MTLTASAMYSVTRLLDVVADERERVLVSTRARAEAIGAYFHLVEPTLPGSRNGGDILIHLRFDSRREWLTVAGSFADALSEPAITRINGVSYPGIMTRSGDGTVYRTLLLRVSPETRADIVTHFEDDLRSMTRFIPARLRILVPTSGLPVNVTIAILGSNVRASPISPPGPVITFRAPAGSPASWKICASRIALMGVADAGL